MLKSGNWQWQLPLPNSQNSFKFCQWFQPKDLVQKHTLHLLVKALYSPSVRNSSSLDFHDLGILKDYRQVSAQDVHHLVSCVSSWCESGGVSREEIPWKYCCVLLIAAIGWGTTSVDPAPADVHLDHLTRAASAGLS